jgi:hypothetical protein
MKFLENRPARSFEAGTLKKIKIKHVGTVELETNEQITFSGQQNSEVDVVKKEWGYYVTPSINKRLINFGIVTYLVQNSKGHIFIMLSEPGEEDKFRKYLMDTNQKIIMNLSDLYCDS